MTRPEPFDPGDLPDLPARSGGVLRPGAGGSPVIVRSPSRPGLSLDPTLDAALQDDHTEDTPPTAIPGHYGYSADELVLRLSDDDDDDDPEATALRKPVTGSTPWVAPDGAPAAADEAVAPPEVPVVAVLAPMAPQVSAPLGSGSVAVPLWAVAVTFFGLGLMAGCLLTLFVMGL